MTKIYLVRFYQFEDQEFASEAFTNIRKALAYKRFWEAKSRNKKWKWHLKMETLNINQLDYTRKAFEEEMKSLPF